MKHRDQLALDALRTCQMVEGVTGWEYLYDIQKVQDAITAIEAAQSQPENMQFSIKESFEEITGNGKSEFSDGKYTNLDTQHDYILFGLAYEAGCIATAKDEKFDTFLATRKFKVEALPGSTGFVSINGHIHKVEVREAQPVGVPAGMKLVLMEPTQEMLKEGRMTEAMWQGRDLHTAVWNAMLAAAPSIPVDEAEHDPLCLKVIRAPWKNCTCGVGLPVDEKVHCPNCPDQGWYAIETGGCGPDGENDTRQMEQVQCEFCYTTPNSVFNANQAAPAVEVELPVAGWNAAQELLGRYWNLAYREGKEGTRLAEEANQVLFEFRAMLAAAPSLPVPPELEADTLSNRARDLAFGYSANYPARDLCNEIANILENQEKQIKNLQQGIRELVSMSGAKTEGTEHCSAYTQAAIAAARSQS